MATLDTTRDSFATRGMGARSHNVFAVLRAALIDWNDARKTRIALSALSDEMLDDLGLCRADISGISGKTIRG